MPRGYLDDFGKTIIGKRRRSRMPRFEVSTEDDDDDCDYKKPRPKKLMTLKLKIRTTGSRVKHDLHSFPASTSDEQLVDPHIIDQAGDKSLMKTQQQALEAAPTLNSSMNLNRQTGTGNQPALLGTSVQTQLTSTVNESMCHPPLKSFSPMLISKKTMQAIAYAAASVWI